MKLKRSGKPKSVRRRQPEEVRARVLRAALQVFAEQGFDGATNRFIAQRFEGIEQLAASGFSAAAFFSARISPRGCSYIPTALRM